MLGFAAAGLIVVIVAAQSLAMARMPRRARGGAEAGAAATDFAAPPPTGGPLGPVVDVLRRHRKARVGLSVLSLLATGAAVVMIGYPFYTNFVQGRIQDRLEREFASPELREAYLEGRIQEGDSLTRLRIPALNVEVVVVEGTTSKSLRAGAGHYSDTAMPCEVGNVGIAGHRTTYGRPFNHVDLLEPGDLIILEIPIGSCTYRVTEKPFIVKPSDSWVIDPPGEAGVSMLTLTTCHPKGSSRQRLIVQAEMVTSDVVRA